MKDGIVIIDLGSQYTHLIARRIRGFEVSCEVLSYQVPLSSLLETRPKGLILSGGPASVYDRKAPSLKQAIFESHIPVLGICYGMQLMMHMMGGEVRSSTSREYGHQKIRLQRSERGNKNTPSNGISPLYAGISKRILNVWMSHGDVVENLGRGFWISATSLRTPASVEDHARGLYGVQYHPEVVHTEEGQQILNNFVFKIAKAKKNWHVRTFMDRTSQAIRKQVGHGIVLLGVSGGVDSTVMAVLLRRILGEQLRCVFVNNGLLRWHEAEVIRSIFADRLGLKLDYVDAREVFLRALKGVTHPEQKRKIIGKVFVEVFMNHYRTWGSHFKEKDFYLAQGTLYPDVIESVSTVGPSETIKTHHNRTQEVLELMKEGRVIEPFKELFKDEVRTLGRQLNVPADLLGRHPFPGPGLAVRILGAVNVRRLELLRHADAIFIEEIRKAKHYDNIWQAFAVLLPVKAVGVMGDGRTYGHVVVLRAITSEDGMTADIYGFSKTFMRRVSSRIIGEVKGITRVTYDISTKPPATIEWE